MASPPLTIGVFGGSFNPIHLGHVLLAITVQQTKAVDRVVLVPVYKHAVKKDLLPFENRVQMCHLAVAHNLNMEVSTIEKDVGESNGAMLRGLKQQYPEGTRFLWICGDDFIRWMDRPKGLETLREVHGLIVQRRLHRDEEFDRFYKMPLDEQKIRKVAAQLDLDIDIIYGELPHFSSTLVRKTPGNWKSFLPQAVVKYLDERPPLLAQLQANLDIDAKSEQQQQPVVPPAASACILRGLDAVHALQRERGSTGMLSMGTEASQEKLKLAQANTDSIVAEIQAACKDEEETLSDYDEVLSLAAELQYIPAWLQRDRDVLSKKGKDLVQLEGVEGWNKRVALVDKFNYRIDVLIHATIRALQEILEKSKRTQKSATPTPQSLLYWCEAKEALGRLRAFVSSAGPNASALVGESLKMRERLNSKIQKKERKLALVLPQNKQFQLSEHNALNSMLEQVTLSEWSLMACFASSTPLPLIHKLVAERKDGPFNVEEFFEASSAAIDFLLTFAKALAASECAGG